MHAAKEAVLPTHSDDEALADQFADFFDDKIAKIHQEFSQSPEMAEEDPIGQPPHLHEFTPITEEDLKKIIVSGNSQVLHVRPHTDHLAQSLTGTPCYQF